MELFDCKKHLRFNSKFTFNIFCFTYTSYTLILNDINFNYFKTISNIILRRWWWWYTIHDFRHDELNYRYTWTLFVRENNSSILYKIANIFRYTYMTSKSCILDKLNMGEHQVCVLRWCNTVWIDDVNGQSHGCIRLLTRCNLMNDLVFTKTSDASKPSRMFYFVLFNYSWCACSKYNSACCSVNLKS